MAYLGFGCGLPYVILSSTLLLWFSEKGISLTVIGISSWFILPYSLKPFWARFIDRCQPPKVLARLGHRRAWLLFSQALVMLGLFVISSYSGARMTAGLALACILTAWAAANQDLLVDTIRIETYETTEGMASSLANYQVGYRIGILTAGSVLLIISANVGWSAIYRIAGCTMSISMLGTFYHKGDKRSLLQYNASPTYHLLWKNFQRKYRFSDLIIIVGGISLFRFPDLVLEPFKNTIYLSGHYAAGTIGTIQGTFGFSGGILGIFWAGSFISRFGLRRAIMVASFVQISQMLSYMLFIFASGITIVLPSVIFIDNISSSFTGTVLVSCFAFIVESKNAIVEYPLLTSIYAIIAKLMRGLFGFILDKLSMVIGYRISFLVFITIITALGFAGFMLLLRWETSALYKRE